MSHPLFWRRTQHKRKKAKQSKPNQTKKGVNTKARQRFAREPPNPKNEFCVTRFTRPWHAKRSEPSMRSSVHATATSAARDDGVHTVGPDRMTRQPFPIRPWGSRHVAWWRWPHRPGAQGSLLWGPWCRRVVLSIDLSWVLCIDRYFGWAQMRMESGVEYIGNPIVILVLLSRFHLMLPHFVARIRPFPTRWIWWCP